MPIPPDLLRVALNFSLGNSEIAVSSFHLKLNHEAGAATNWPQMTQDAADKVLLKWRTQMNTNAANQFPQSVKLQSVATYHLDQATGHAIDKGIAVSQPTATWAGLGTASLPFECALAVSLYGYTPGSFVVDRGRKRGRMFLPPLTSSVMGGGTDAAAGRIAADRAGFLADAMGNFFNDVHKMSVGQDPLNIGQTWDLVVLSRAGNFTTPVQAIRVGDVIDSQRRRRNHQVESYQDRAITDS